MVTDNESWGFPNPLFPQVRVPTYKREASSGISNVLVVLYVLCTTGQDPLMVVKNVDVLGNKCTERGR